MNEYIKIFWASVKIENSLKFLSAIRCINTLKKFRTFLSSVQVATNIQAGDWHPNRDRDCPHHSQKIFLFTPRVLSSLSPSTRLVGRTTQNLVQSKT